MNDGFMSNLPGDFPTTLQDAMVYFGDPDKARVARSNSP
jgi:hypothetical protein